MEKTLKIVRWVIVGAFTAILANDFYVYTEGGETVFSEWILGPKYTKELMRLEGTWENRMYTVSINIKKGTFKGRLFDKSFSKRFEVLKIDGNRLGLEIFDDENDFSYRLGILFLSPDTATFLKEGGLPMQVKRKKK